MNFLTQYFQLRFKLLYRNFELGTLFWLLPLILFGGTIYTLINYTEAIHSRQIQLLLANIIFLFLIHNKRKDGHFLKNSLTTQQLRTVYFIEYLLLSIPFIILAIGSLNWLHLVIIPFLIILSSLTFSIGRKTKPTSLFKKSNIEWNSGFRIYGLAPIALIGIFISSFFLPTTSYLNIFIFGVLFLTLSSFQAIEEEASFIRIFDCSPQQFLIQKIKATLIPLALIGCIALIPILIVEQGYWPIIILVTAQGLIYNANTILGNYANYQNEAGKLITFFVKIIFTVVPFLLPLNIILTVFLYRKAITSLKPYLYAND